MTERFKPLDDRVALSVAELPDDMAAELDTALADMKDVTPASGLIPTFGTLVFWRR